MRIKESTFHAMHEMLISETLLQILRERECKGNKLIVRFKCANEECKNKVWMTDDERMCKTCGSGRKTVRHMFNECVEIK